MSSAGTTDRDALSVRVRAETWEAHQEAERAPFVQDLLGGRLPVGEYARLAVQHHAVYEVLEAAVAANSDPVLEPFLAPELARLPSLVADLDVLAGAGWRDEIEVLASTRAYREHLREVCSGSSQGLLAHHYLRYLGDLSGGQLIGRVLRRVYGFDGDRGTAFYQFPGIVSPKAFKARYRGLLDELPWDEARRRALIDEVSDAYRYNADILYELAPLPVLASQPHPRADSDPTT